MAITKNDEDMMRRCYEGALVERKERENDGYTRRSR